MGDVGAQDGKVHVPALDLPSGTLSPVQDIDAGVNPSFLAFSADKKNLYSVDQSQDTIRAYSIPPRDGRARVARLGALSGRIAADARRCGGDWQVRLRREHGERGRPDDWHGGGRRLRRGGEGHLHRRPRSSGRVRRHQEFVFVPNLGGGTVSQLVFDAGAFTLAYNSPSSVSLPAGAGPRHMALHPTAPYAYVIRETDDSVAVFPLDAQQGTSAPRSRRFRRCRPAWTEGGTPQRTSRSTPSGKAPLRLELGARQHRHLRRGSRSRQAC